MRLSEFTLLHHPARLVEKVIIRDRAASDVDGEIRDLTIHMNPSRQEAEALLSKSVEKAIRGFVRENDGTVVIWDAYLTDHGGADYLLKQHGYGNWWPRFSVEMREFQQGVIRNYLDGGIDEDGWDAVPREHLTRMFGTEPRFVPT
jgi:hypothetical protein